MSGKNEETQLSRIENLLDQVRREQELSKERIEKVGTDVSQARMDISLLQSSIGGDRLGNAGLAARIQTVEVKVAENQRATSAEMTAMKIKVIGVAAALTGVFNAVIAYFKSGGSPPSHP